MKNHALVFALAVASAASAAFAEEPAHWATKDLKAGVIGTVNDLDNVLYEISNESQFLPGIQAWQEQMVRYVNQYQAGKPQQHPVGMTNLIAGAKEKLAANAALFASSAD